MKKAAIIGLVVIYAATVKSQPLGADSLIHYYFNDQEIEQLQSIVYFFDDQVTQECNQEVAGCLHAYSEALADTMLKTGNLRTGIDPKKRDHLLQSLDYPVFNAIWDYSDAHIRLAPDSTIRYWQVGYNLSGKFFKYLSATSYITNTTLKPYVQSIEAAGTLPPSMVITLLKGHALFNFTNERNRLVYALHCLTLKPHRIPRIDRDLLRIENPTRDSVYVELWKYPAEESQNNLAEAFNTQLYARQSFTLTFDGLYIAEKNAEISPAFRVDEQLGFEVRLYQQGDVVKDTLLLERIPTQEMINQAPLVITVP